MDNLNKDILIEQIREKYKDVIFPESAKKCKDYFDGIIAFLPIDKLKKILE